MEWEEHRYKIIEDLKRKGYTREELIRMIRGTFENMLGGLVLWKKVMEKVYDKDMDTLREIIAILSYYVRLYRDGKIKL